jgi:hypothetical protein
MSHSIPRRDPLRHLACSSQPLQHPQTAINSTVLSPATEAALSYGDPSSSLLSPMVPFATTYRHCPRLPSFIVRHRRPLSDRHSRPSHATPLCSHLCPHPQARCSPCADAPRPLRFVLSCDPPPPIAFLIAPCRPDSPSPTSRCSSHPPPTQPQASQSS